ncbi:hypothetical protein quinque_010192 [Culex quinquefasciatus]
MKIGLCAFSGFKIYPASGKTLTFTFINKKCERSFLMKRNPRKVKWTVLYRRKHKKGIEALTNRDIPFCSSRVAKEAKKAKQAEKKVTKAPAAKQQKTKAAKVSQKAAPRVGGKR